MNALAVKRQTSSCKPSKERAVSSRLGFEMSLDEGRAALILQHAWRCTNPRVLRTNKNISILREKLMSYVQKSKGLTAEDFFLLFTYSIYTGICDTCFLYFDCAEYEDGEVYLMPDPAIKCTDSYYQGSVLYVVLMSVILPFGIPCYYSYALYRNRGVVNPSLSKVLKDKDYVHAFACAGVLFLGPDGERLQGEALHVAQKSRINKWKAANPALHKSLEGRDYESQFQQKLEQAGFKKAKQWILIRARDASIPARRFKFLWGPYRTGMFGFEVLDIFRRFLITGFPKLLHAIAPGATAVQVYIGLLVLAVAPAGYSSMDPYCHPSDKALMILTQLAQVVVMLCAMLGGAVRGNLGNIICTVVIMCTLLPMFAVLLLYVIDPTGHLVHRLLARTKIDKKWDLVKELLLSIGGEDKEVRQQIQFVINEIEEGELDDIETIMEIVARLFQCVISLDEDLVKDCVCELLSAFGLSHKKSFDLVDKLGLKLLAWTLRPVLGPYLAKRGLEWADVVPVLEEVDSIEELKQAAADPAAFLEQLVNASGPAAKKLAIMHLKPRLDPYLKARELEWADVVPVLETIDSIEELRTAAADPEALLERVSQASGPAAKKLAIMHLKPRLDPYLKARELEWADVVPVLETIDSIEELRTAAADPEALLERVYKKLAIMHVKPLRAYSAAPTPCAGSVAHTIGSGAVGPAIGTPSFPLALPLRYSEELSRLPSPSERISRVMAQEAHVDEQGRQDKCTAAAAAAAAVVPAKSLEAMLLKLPQSIR
jgi:predicted protein tyrosine phosphatase